MKCHPTVPKNCHPISHVHRDCMSYFEPFRSLKRQGEGHCLSVFANFVPFLFLPCLLDKGRRNFLVDPQEN